MDSHQLMRSQSTARAPAAQCVPLNDLTMHDVLNCFNFILFTQVMYEYSGLLKKFKQYR